MHQKSFARGLLLHLFNKSLYYYYCNFRYKTRLKEEFDFLSELSLAKSILSFHRYIACTFNF